MKMDITIFEKQREDLDRAIQLGGICIGISKMLERSCTELPEGKDKLIEIANGLLEELREEHK